MTLLSAIDAGKPTTLDSTAFSFALDPIRLWPVHRLEAESAAFEQRNKVHEPSHPSGSSSDPADEPHDDARPGHDSVSDFPGRAILSAPNSREVLARLMDGDPLEIDARCRERILSRALMLALRRVYLRAVARIAHQGPRYRGVPELDVWLAARIDEALDDLLAEDREEELSGVPPTSPWDPRFAFISETLGIEPALARRACLSFNVLPDEVRHAYFSIAVEGKSLHRYVAEGNGPPSRVREHLNQALAALGLRIDPDQGGSEVSDER
jgi:hypothetical protein